MIFRVCAQVFEALPELHFACVVARGMDNHTAPPPLATMLEHAAQHCRATILPDDLKNHPSIRPYRDAFFKLGINPNKYPSSIESMLKRTLKGGSPPSINPAVDCGNALSLKYMVPMGAHDLDQLTDEIAVRFSRAGDRFLPLGEAEEEALEAGELIYADASHVRTRRWIWRQSQQGCIDTESRTIFFPIDGFFANSAAVDAAATELEALLRLHWSCTTARFTVDAAHPSVLLD